MIQETSAQDLARRQIDAAFAADWPTLERLYADDVQATHVGSVRVIQLAQSREIPSAAHPQAAGLQAVEQEDRMCARVPEGLSSTADHYGGSLRGKMQPVGPPRGKARG